MPATKTALSYSLLALTLVTGCFSEVTASSRSYLGPDQSSAVTTHSAQDAAREVTRLLAARGYAMLDQQPGSQAGQVVLKLGKGDRSLAATRNPDPDLTALGPRFVGSVFYVAITPNANAGASISMIGKPTLAGVEPCTNDGLPCTKVEVEPRFSSLFMNGHVEADTVHGVLSELALEGYIVTQPAPRVAECIAARHQAFDQASKTTDLDARAKLLQSAPVCDAT